MSNKIRLIIGLGNPGKDYENTRHNAGAWFVNQIAESSNAFLKIKNQLHASHGIAKLIENIDCHLAIPTTYMNLSGLAVKSLSRYYKIQPEEILIVHDEIDLPVGDIRLKYDGGSGGHNGLSDIIKHLNTKKFYRLRVGVGRPSNAKDVVDYVLKKPSKSEKALIEESLQKAINLLPQILAGEFQQAMHKLHT